MRMLMERALALFGVLLVLYVIGQGSPEALAIAVAVIAITTVATLHVVAAIAPRHPVSGSRASLHRTLTGSQPEPNHPRTAGRPLSRAPGSAIAAA